MKIKSRARFIERSLNAAINYGALVQELEKEKPETTTWTYDKNDDAWACQSCDLYWQLISGTPQENGVKFCPQCGIPIGTFKYQEEDDDE